MACEQIQVESPGPTNCQVMHDTKCFLTPFICQYTGPGSSLPRQDSNNTLCCMMKGDMLARCKNLVPLRAQAGLVCLLSYHCAFPSAPHRPLASPWPHLAGATFSPPPQHYLQTAVHGAKAYCPSRLVLALSRTAIGVQIHVLAEGSYGKNTCHTSIPSL